jgi:pantoate--beta-alanine ligase
MIIVKKINDLQKFLAVYADKGQRAGFVPTMGALHNGHISLVAESKKNNLFTVCSIFVNPTQFNDPRDYEKYPITLENDILLLEQSGCDILFVPPVKEIYPDGTMQLKHYDLGYLEKVLEGQYRPGHFQGVCMVIDKLLNIVNSGNLYLGQKDYQQCMVIKKLVELTGREKSLTVNICPTLRETDGLAMSSRNMRLGEEERKRAATIYKVLLFIKNGLVKGNVADLKDH